MALHNAIKGGLALILTYFAISHTTAQAIEPAYQARQMAVPPTLKPYEPAQRSQAAQAVYRPAQAAPAPSPVRLRKASRSNHRLSAQRRAILDSAFSALGVKYRWGGNSRREGFDCSGFTKFAYKNANINIPRVSREQSRVSRTIRRQDLRPGDMIFFKTSGRVVNHVGIYIGNGQFIHAASGGGKVTIDDLRKNYWQKRLVKYGTFVG